MGHGGSDWFDDARLGLFVHWGHSSQAGVELSWPMVGGIDVLPHSDPLTVAEYQATAATFDPEPDAARRWAELARAAGMRYAVLTARHHDGFSLWPSAHSDFSVGQAPYRGDLVGEFVEAMRSAGLRVGLYYSLSDWHHPDYPAWRDEDRPYRLGAYPAPEPAAWARYLDYLFGQIRELLTGYGPIDVLWFDGGWERTPAQWRTDELRALIAELQPDCLVNDRLPGFGDFVTPEQFLPARPPADRWETCLTMNRTWGWNPRDTDYKSPTALVHTLAQVSALGGNLLLNVSPRGDGTIPEPQVARLEALARWMEGHGTAITATRPALEPWQFYGPTTRAGSTLYLHLLARPYETVEVRAVPIRRVAAVNHLASATPLTFRTSCSIVDEMFNHDPSGTLTIEVPAELIDDHATVVAVEISGW